MKNLWNDDTAKEFSKDDLDLRVYTSRLLGQDQDLVLHGGGNTSVKIFEKNIFGEEEEILYVKGSGWDLATIERPGFSPCSNSYLVKLAELETMTDTEMVRESRISLKDPGAPNPSVEAILHAIIPKKFVDHTHADSVVTISNTPNGEEKLKSLYGNNVLVLPYIMPGFILAKQIQEATKNIDWDKLEAIVLLNHGIFTFSDNARIAYSMMIDKVTMAENYIKENGNWDGLAKKKSIAVDTLKIAKIRKTASILAGKPLVTFLKDDEQSCGYASHEKVNDFGTRGTVTPDHVITTKATPMIIEDDPDKSVEIFSNNYKNYFERNDNGQLTILDSAPRYGLWKNHGILCLATDVKRLKAARDIIDHTVKCVQQGESLGGWRPLDEKNLFDLEYWELEQAKLKKSKSAGEFQSKIALVSGAASGIGKSVVDKYISLGACVVALDIDIKITELWNSPQVLGLVCDVTNTEQLKLSLENAVKNFGGIDIVVSNAGSFPGSCKIEDTDDSIWQKAIDLNFTSHMKLIRAATPYLKQGIDPSIAIVASKNVPAPGPGQAAYSTSKAAITQLARVAALELGEFGINVNTVHPNAVFDTAIWTQEVLESRAKSYGISVEEYKTNNLLKREITSKDVASLIADLTSSNFSKTTGAQVPIDGGNDRVV